MVFLSILFIVIAALADCVLGDIQCACAASNVHLRNGPGTDYDVIATLMSHDCLRYEGESQSSDSYTWLHLIYHDGQSVWAASNWAIPQTCTDNLLPLGNSSSVQLPGCPRIVTRSEWGARPAKAYAGDMPDPPPVYVFVHHGAGGECFNKQDCIHKVQGYQDFHMDGRGWNDIGYNFVVGEDGNAYEGRGWIQIGAHTRGYNRNGIAISVIGNFMSKLPNQAALTTVQGLIRCGLDNGMISQSYTLKGHRDVGNTECPGDTLYNHIQDWPHYRPGTELYRP